MDMECMHFESWVVLLITIAGIIMAFRAVGWRARYWALRSVHEGVTYDPNGYKIADEPPSA